MKKMTSLQKIWFLSGFALLVSAGILLFGLWQISRDLTDSADGTPTPEVEQLPLVVEILPSPTVTRSVTLIPTFTASPETSPFVQSITPITATPSATIGSSTEVAAASNTESACPPPEGWVGHTVEAGDTLFAFQLGSGNSASVEDILDANCLSDRWIYEGQFLYLPPGAAENAPSSEIIPTTYIDPSAPPPPMGLTRSPNCPCEVTIRVGWRLEQIAEYIDSLPVGFYGRDFMAVAGKGASYPSRDFLAGAPPGALLEGYMLPGTYIVTNEMDARMFRDMVLDAFGAATGGLWGDALARGMTPYAAVTLASIIVKESGNPENQAMISSVFHNRLNIGNGLGATVTTMYALGRPGDWWPSVAGQISTFDSPYNTNLYRGLPPSPIASPSLSALQAAVYPPPSNYFYFSENCRGPGIFFAETYEQHLANVRCE